MAPTKKKKPTRSERNAQRARRVAAAEAARGGFVCGSSRGDAASGSAGGPSGFAGGDSKVGEEQVTPTSSNGYPSLNLSTRVESFGLPPAIDEQTGLPYPALPPSSRVEKPKVKQYPDGMVYNNVPLNDYHGLTDDLVSAREAHDKLSYQVLAAAEKSRDLEQRALVAEEENQAIKAQLTDVVDEMKKTFAKTES